MSDTASIIEREQRHIVQCYRRAPIVLVHGQGCHVYDADGRQYLDFASGVGVASLGHGHLKLAEAIAGQAAGMLHCSNLFYHPLQGALAARLAELSGLPRAFFCNSGTEAVEACLKLARRYWSALGEPRTEIVALERAFHGRTFGSLSVTWDAHYRVPFGPLLADVRFVAPNDSDALQAAVTSRTAAIIVEPIQGEGGVHPLTPEFARTVNAAAERTGALVIADEVQSGLGRTGHAFYSGVLGLKPHLIAVGKALGAGVPVAATLASEQVASAMGFGDHGSTYGGNLLACRAALVFLDELTAGGLMQHVRAIEPVFRSALDRLRHDHAIVKEVRGFGAMWGVELTCDATQVVDAARAHALLVTRASAHVVRLLPPLVVTAAEIEQGAAALDAAFTSVEPGVAA